MLGFTADPSQWFGNSQSYDTPTDGTVATNIATVNAAPTTTNDSWGDWFKAVGTGILVYSIKKDAAITGAQLGYRGPQAPANQPTYTAQPIQQNLLSGNMVLIGLAVAAFLVLKK